MSADRPIFILASQCAHGPTLAAMLGQHPELFDVPELHLFAADTMEQYNEYAKFPREFYKDGLLRLVSVLFSGEQNIEGIQMARRWLGRFKVDTTATLHQALRKRIAPLQMVEYSRLYGDNTQIMQRILGQVPNARFIHLVRNPITQGECLIQAIAQATKAYLQEPVEYAVNRPNLDIEYISENYLDYSVDPVVPDPQYSWYRTQRNIMAFLDTLPEEQYLRVFVEDLAKRPKTELKRLCSHFGLKATRTTIDRMMSPQLSPFASYGPYLASLGDEDAFLQQHGVLPSKSRESLAIEGMLPWRDDGLELLAPVAKLAREIGYR